MLPKMLRKTPDQTPEGKTKSRMPFATTIGHHHRKAIFAIICILTIVVFGMIIEGFGSNQTVVYASSVKGIGTGIYWDQNCTNSTLSLDWGLITSGSNNTLTVYVKNEGNSEITLLLRTSNWNPSSSSDYMSLNWNYSGQILSTNQVIPLELTLTVNSYISGVTSFSFDTTFTAIGEL
jgi:hypothetical protein